MKLFSAFALLGAVGLANAQSWSCPNVQECNSSVTGNGKWTSVNFKFDTTSYPRVTGSYIHHTGAPFTTTFYMLRAIEYNSDPAAASGNVITQLTSGQAGNWGWISNRNRVGAFNEAYSQFSRWAGGQLGVTAQFAASGGGYCPVSYKLNYKYTNWPISRSKIGILFAAQTYQGDITQSGNTIIWDNGKMKYTFPSSHDVRLVSGSYDWNSGFHGGWGYGFKGVFVSPKWSTGKRDGNVDEEMEVEVETQGAAADANGTTQVDKRWDSSLISGAGGCYVEVDCSPWSYPPI